MISDPKSVALGVSVLLNSSRLLKERRGSYLLIPNGKVLEPFPEGRVIQAARF